MHGGMEGIMSLVVQIHDFWDGLFLRRTLDLHVGLGVGVFDDGRVRNMMNAFIG